MTYQNILVPHAGTPAGNKALEHAKKIAKTHHSKITLLHIVEEIPLPPSFGLTNERLDLRKQLNSARREMKIEMHGVMEKLAKKLRAEEIPTSVKVIHGYPDEEISRMVNKENYDLVVMSKRRKLTGFKAILKLGSVSRKVLEKISCPILLVDGEK